MESEICYIDTSGKAYFKVEDGVVYSRDRKTDVSPDKLSDFLAIAKELGSKLASYESGSDIRQWGEDCRRHLALPDWQNPQATFPRRVRAVVCGGV